MTFYVQKNSFMYRLFLEIPQGAEKMEFRFIYVNIFCCLNSAILLLNFEV